MNTALLNQLVEICLLCHEQLVNKSVIASDLTGLGKVSNYNVLPK